MKTRLAAHPGMNPYVGTAYVVFLRRSGEPVNQIAGIRRNPQGTQQRRKSRSLFAVTESVI
ncbi:MAG: hypothetical protein U9M95_05735 [Candidatus Altiarchaeota archaeon]|nr:hypothetical protein [Candidatus Altiarchaeota archaeon]